MSQHQCVFVKVEVNDCVVNLNKHGTALRLRAEAHTVAVLLAVRHVFRRAAAAHATVVRLREPGTYASAVNGLRSE